MREIDMKMRCCACHCPKHVHIWHIYEQEWAHPHVCAHTHKTVLVLKYQVDAVAQKLDSQIHMHTHKFILM